MTAFVTGQTERFWCTCSLVDIGENLAAYLHLRIGEKRVGSAV